MSRNSSGKVLEWFWNENAIQKYNDCIGGYLNLDQDLDQELKQLNYWEETKYWERVQQSNNLYKLPKETRPCISQILGTAITEGSSPGRSKSGLYIAVELRKFGLNDKQIKQRLDNWNVNNDPPLIRSEIKNVLIQSEKKKFNDQYLYAPGCNNVQLKEFCIGKDSCYYYQKNFKGKGKREPSWLSLGWQHVLTVREQLLLCYVLPRIEGIRKQKKGTNLTISVRELNYWTGIDQTDFNDICSRLKHYGLIEYTPGSSRVWEHKASEIRRIIPPPEIPNEYKTEEKNKGYKRYKAEIRQKFNKAKKQQSKQVKSNT